MNCCQGDEGFVGKVGGEGPKGFTVRLHHLPYMSISIYSHVFPQGPAGQRGPVGLQGAEGPKGDTGKWGGEGSFGLPGPKVSKSINTPQ